MLFQDQAHAYGAVKNGMSRVVVVVPVWEVDVGGEEFGFDDQEAARVKKLVELREFGLGMVKVFDDFAADDKIVGGV